MFKVNIHDAKTNLSKYLAEMGLNDRLIICKRNEPIAEIRILKPVASLKDDDRPIGDNPDTFEIPESFFDPLPEEILKYFS